jgi:hypothetical protein
MSVRARRLARASVLFLLAGLITAGSACAQGDPGAPGPLAVTTSEYDYGDSAFSVAGFPGPIEVRARVHYPTSLTGGPFPLVVFLHGRHVTCYLGSSAFLQWPCTSGRSPIPSYQGYDYVGTILASHGYIVVSVSANGINAADNSDLTFGMDARGQLIQHHLDIWNTFNATGAAPFGSLFVGKVNMANVGTMGHSRGGEGVVWNFEHNARKGSPYGIRAVFPLAPVDFFRHVINNVPLAVLLPYCDGDVSNLQGVHFYDDARYNVPGDTGPKDTILVMGANHNFYNTIWTPGGWPAGTADDWLFSGSGSDPQCGTSAPTRLSATQERGTGLAYLTAFFRVNLGGESAFFSYLQGDAAPPPSAMTSNIHVSYHPADDPSLRRDVNRLLDATNLTTNTLGGTASQSGFSPYDLCGAGGPEPSFCLGAASSTQQPHSVGLSQLRGGWSSTSATYTNTLPVGARDVSGFLALQLRLSVDFGDGRNPVSAAQDLSVRLTDGDGLTATVKVSDHTTALYYPPGTSSSVLPKILLNTIRLPLSSFGGVNLADVRSVQFRFDQKPSGAFLISDIAFADSASSLPPLRLFSCGTGFTATTIGISDRGNVMRFSSPGPSGHEHLTARSGYKLCYATTSGGPIITAFDVGTAQGGWDEGVTVSQPGGPGTFPLEITRTTADGKVQITRRFTGNSFVATGGLFDLNGDGVSCSTLAECGNCANRTLHVLTRINNLTAGTLFSVDLVEVANFDIEATAGGDRFARTADGVLAFEDGHDSGGNAHGMLLQALILPAAPRVFAAGGYAEAGATCSQAGMATPTAPGDFEAVLEIPFGSVGPGSNTGSNIRAHYRRF